MAKKARQIRERTGDDGFYAPIERQPKMSLAKHLEGTLARPFKMLAQEPMLLVITIYMSVSLLATCPA